MEVLRRQRIEHQQAIEQIDTELTRLEPQTGPGRLWLEFADLFDAALALGQQYPCGFPTIDRMTDGGLARGTVTVIQGKAGIGKTLVATQIARALAPRCAVAALFQDEGLAGARVRIGQQLGLERRRMRRPDDLAKQEAVRAMTAAAAFWKFMRPTDKRATVEVLAQEFDRKAPEGIPRVWLIDSAQVARSEKTKGQADRRLSISDLLWTVRDLADEFAAIALVVSQVSRASYASKDKEKRVEDLAAGAETRAVEQVSDLLLHIDGNPKQKVEIRCAKNRYTGELFSLPCRVDFPTATFHELDQAVMEGEEQAQNEANLKRLAAKIVEFLKVNPDSTGNKIHDSIRGRARDIDDARKWLAERKDIFSTDGPRRAQLWRLAK